MTLTNSIYLSSKIYFRVVVLLCASSLAFAQTGGEVQNETIVVEKNKLLDLPLANREFEKISDPQPQAIPTTSKYQVQDISIVLPQFDTKVKVPTTKTDEPIEIHNGYVKAGFGNYATTYLEGFIHTGKKKNYSAGAHFKHLSSANGPYKGVKNSLNSLDLQGKYWTSKQWINGALKVGRERYTLYGIGDRGGIDWDSDSLKNTYNKVQAEVSTGNMTDGKTSYNTKVHYDYQTNNHKENESDVGVLLNLLHKKADDRAILGDVFLDYSTYSDTSTFSRVLAGFSGKYSMKKDELKITVGLNYTYSGDTLKGSLGSHIYPLIDLNYTLIPNQLIAEAGLKGDMEKNTWMSYTAQNPYLDNNITLANTNNTMNIYLALKGHVQQKINFKVGGAYLTYKNLWFMVNSPSDTTKFTVVYDKDNASAFNLNGELTYDSKSFRTGLKLDYYSYQVGDAIKKAWHRPSFIGTFFASYSIYKKIVLKSDIYYIGCISAINLVSNKETNLKDIVDVNLKAEYRLSDKFSTFLELNNLLSMKYQRYMYYQSRGLNLMLGLTYRF